MSKVEYSKKSPYFKTEQLNEKLEVANLPVIPKYSDDIKMRINETYQYRPDLLAYDLYGDSQFWWVFAARNPNIIEDPIFDMRLGRIIYVPKQTTIERVIG